MRRALALIIACAMATLAIAQSESFIIGPSPGLDVLNSRSVRDGFWAGYEWTRPEPRLAFWGMSADICLEPYALFSVGREGCAIGGIFHLGLLAAARYWLTPDSFAYLGMGVQYVTENTEDFGVRLNTTPTIGYGHRIEVAGEPLLLSLRFHHISNGGRAVPNTGGNFLVITLAYPF